MTRNGRIAVFVEPITYHFAADRLFEPHGYAGSYYEPFGSGVLKFEHCRFSFASGQCRFAVRRKGQHSGTLR